MVFSRFGRQEDEAGIDKSTLPHYMGSSILERPLGGGSMMEPAVNSSTEANGLVARGRRIKVGGQIKVGVRIKVEGGGEGGGEGKR